MLYCHLILIKYYDSFCRVFFYSLTYYYISKLKFGIFFSFQNQSCILNIKTTRITNLHWTNKMKKNATSALVEEKYCAKEGQWITPLIQSGTWCRRQRGQWEAWLTNKSWTLGEPSMRSAKKKGGLNL